MKPAHLERLAGVGNAGHAQRSAHGGDLGHLHPVGDEVLGRAVGALDAQAVLAGAQQRVAGQAQLLGAAVEFEQHVHLVRHGLFADHAQQVAVEEVQVPPGDRVESLARTLQQAQEDQQQRHVRPGVGFDGAGGITFGALRVVGQGIEIELGVVAAEHGAPVALRLVVEIDKVQLAGIRPDKGQQLTHAAVVERYAGRIEPAQRAAGLAGAVDEDRVWIGRCGVHGRL